MNYFTRDLVRRLGSDDSAVVNVLAGFEGSRPRGRLRPFPCGRITDTIPADMLQVAGGRQGNSLCPAWRFGVC
jgi:hypothetical protein